MWMAPFPTRVQLLNPAAGYANPSTQGSRRQPMSPAAELAERGPNRMSGVISSTVLQPQ